MLKAWEEVYNGVRPHQALGYLTPKAFYQQLAQAAVIVSPMYRMSTKALFPALHPWYTLPIGHLLLEGDAIWQQPYP